jgi:hypothetical protein
MASREIRDITDAGVFPAVIAYLYNLFVNHDVVSYFKVINHGCISWELSLRK